MPFSLAYNALRDTPTHLHTQRDTVSFTVNFSPIYYPLQTYLDNSNKQITNNLCQNLHVCPSGTINLKKKKKSYRILKSLTYSNYVIIALFHWRISTPDYISLVILLKVLTITTSSFKNFFRAPLLLKQHINTMI